jgi:hypothetical protein
MQRHQMGGSFAAFVFYLARLRLNISTCVRRARGLDWANNTFLVGVVSLVAEGLQIRMLGANSFCLRIFVRLGQEWRLFDSSWRWKKQARVGRCPNLATDLVLRAQLSTQRPARRLMNRRRRQWRTENNTKNDSGPC